MFPISILPFSNVRTSSGEFRLFFCNLVVVELIRVTLV
jgi:hypothetical protein